MNAVLPNTKLTGSLDLLEVFDYYDGPKLFVCNNAIGQRFLGYWTGSNEVGDIYWLVPVSRERHLMIRSGGVSLFHAISKPELGYLHRCVVHFQDATTDDEVVLPENLQHDLLPDPDELIELPTETLPQRLVELDLPRKAVALQREIMGLHFKFPGTREEAPTKLIGKLLVSFQDTLDALGQNLGGSPTMRGVIAPEILANTETRLVHAAGGSFAVEISAAKAVNLFGASLIGDVVAEVVEILNIGNDVERLREKLFAIKPRAASKYRIFLMSLLSAESPLTLDWASPDSTRNQSISFDLDTAAGALKTVEQVTSELGETRTAVGHFVGVELPRRTFTAVLVGSDDSFKGRISDAAMPMADHIILNQSYRITIRETLEVSASGEERSKYELEKIESVE